MMDNFRSLLSIMQQPFPVVLHSFINESQCSNILKYTLNGILIYSKCKDHHSLTHYELG